MVIVVMVTGRNRGTRHENHGGNAQGAHNRDRTSHLLPPSRRRCSAPPNCGIDVETRDRKKRHAEIDIRMSEAPRMLSSNLSS
jgi:hypothetical protein